MQITVAYQYDKTCDLIKKLDKASALTFTENSC